MDGKKVDGREAGGGDIEVRMRGCGYGLDRIALTGKKKNQVAMER